jgi:hypothetical protein
MLTAASIPAPRRTARIFQSVVTRRLPVGRYRGLLSAHSRRPQSLEGEMRNRLWNKGVQTPQVKKPGFPSVV